MLDPLLIWLQFFFCLGVIAVAGLRLSRYGVAIAALTGLSRNWIGLVLVATVTSLPELVTGLSAVTVAQAPDIAVGNILGACVLNLAMLALIDVLYRKETIYAVAGRGHVLTASFGILLLAAAGFGLLPATRALLPPIGHIGMVSLLIVALYLIAMRTLYLAEQRRTAPPAPAPEPAIMTLKSAVMGYGIASMAIIGGGILLPLVGVELAQVMGWSDSFVGSLLIALATCMPELATTWGAIRLGAVDLALGNLLGSNIFNLLILALDDFAYLPGPIYDDTSPLLAVSALIAALMSATVIAGLMLRPASRLGRSVNWVSLLLVAFYLLNAAVQYLHG